ncbi:MAG: hypothetical protein SVP52_07550 [Chloroflexota bacterium]|nr:hypothetical protein [Chloroflexota bacterium]
MALTLASAKTTLQTHLQDLTSLIFSDSTLEEAIRSSLRSLNRISDPPFTIAGLDGAVSTSITSEEEPLIIDGGVAYALNFRAVGLYGDPSPDEDLPKEFSDYAQARMSAFLALLTQVELGTPVSLDDHAHELAVIAAKHANDLIIQSAEHAQQDSIQASEHAHEESIQTSDQAHDLSVIAAEHDNDVIIQSAEHIHEESIQASEHTHDLDVIDSKHDKDVIIQSAEHTHEDSIQASDQAHDLDVIAAEHTNKKEIIQDEIDREDAKEAAEQARLEELQQSADHPYSEWEWEEGDGF